MKRMLLALLFIVSLFLVACSNDDGDVVDVDQSADQEETPITEEETPVELTISAAVSLTDALEEIQNRYEEENNVKLTFNLGGSGTLAQQIIQGAPVDVFISANEKWVDTLEEEALTITSTRQDVTGNHIVLITQKDSALNYTSFEDIKKEDLDQIAIGNPESVPAGSYTEQILTNIGLWDELEPTFVFAKDVRQVLTYVESGNTDIGFVYESDAQTSDDITILASAEKEWHDPIIYPGTVLSDTKHEAEATAFLEYLLSEEAQSILAEYGFKQGD